MSEPTDWKEQEASALNWVTAALALVLVAVYLQLGRRSGQSTYFAVATGLLGWLAVFFTPFWRPILYVPAAVLTTTVTAFWLAWGSWTEPLRGATILLNVAFLATTSYLLISEDRFA